MSGFGLLCCAVLFLDGLRYSEPTDAVDALIDRKRNIYERVITHAESEKKPRTEDILFGNVSVGENQAFETAHTPNYGSMSPFIGRVDSVPGSTNGSYVGTPREPANVVDREESLDYWRKRNIMLYGQQWAGGKINPGQLPGGGMWSPHHASSTDAFAAANLPDRWKDQFSPLLHTFHHPFCSTFADFACWKVVLLLLSWFTAGAYWCLLYANSDHHNQYKEDTTVLKDSLTNMWVQLSAQTHSASYIRLKIAEVALCLLTVLWMVWIYSAASYTKTVLLHTKLSRFRFRQILFRLLSVQANTTIVGLTLWTTWLLSIDPDIRQQISEGFEREYSLLRWLTVFGEWILHWGLPYDVFVPSPAWSLLSIEWTLLVTSCVFAVVFAVLPPWITEEGDEDEHGQVGAVNVPVNALNAAKDKMISVVRSSWAAHQRPILKVMENSFKGLSPDMDESDENLRQVSLSHESENDATFVKLCSAWQARSPQAFTQHWRGRRSSQYLNSNNVKVFCLETALRFLEISYQTYFPVELQKKKEPPTISVPLRRAPKRSLKKIVKAKNPFADSGDEIEGSSPINDTLLTNVSSTRGQAISKPGNPFEISDEADMDIGALKLSMINEKLQKDLLNPFHQNEGSTYDNPPLDDDASQHSPVAPFAPAQNLSGLGFSLFRAFRNDAFTTFGFLCVNEDLGMNLKASATEGRARRIVVAFRGSLPGNAGTNLKLLQTAIPNVKRSTANLWALLGGSQSASQVSTSEKSPTSGSRSDLFASMDEIDLEEANKSHADRASLSDQFIRSTAHVVEADDSAVSGTAQIVEQVKTFGSAIPLVNQSFARVHAGFWDAYCSIRDDFMSGLIAALLEHYRDCSLSSLGGGKSVAAPPELVFCGHSLGAAIASLAAYEAAENMPLILEVLAKYLLFVHEANNKSDRESQRLQSGYQKLKALLYSPPVMSLYKYGSPRIGNPAFGQLMEARLSAIFRIQVNGDAISMMPKFIGLYRHFGTAVIVDDEATGSLLLQPTMIEKSLLRHATGSLSAHSLDTYRHCLEACFEEDELSVYLARERARMSTKG